MAASKFGLTTINHSYFKDEKVLYDVVVVHGLYGSRHSSWTDVEWKGRFLRPLHDGSESYPRLSLYTYDVFGSAGGILTQRGARDEATKLLDSLLELRYGGSKDIPITFIVHDLGGSLVKEAVVLAQQRKYEDIYTSIKLMVFLGCPHQGLKRDLQAGCANLLMSHGKMTYPEAFDLSEPLVDWIQATNSSFAETRMSAIAIMYCGISTHPNPKERVFDTFATSMLAKADRFTTDLGHKDLLKHPFLSSLGAKLDGVRHASNASLHRYLNIFVSQFPPQYPIDTVPLPREKFGRSHIRGAFQEFIQSTGAGCWLVQTPGYPGCGAIEAAEKVIEWTNDLAERNKLHSSYGYFTFDAHDSYRDSAGAALSSLLTELCSRCFSTEEIEAAQQTLHSLNLFNSTQAEDLYTAYVGLVLETLQLHKNRSSATFEPTFTIVLGNLDGRIKNGAWLYKKFKDIVNDCNLRLKVVITSSDPASLAPDVGSTEAVASSVLGPGLPNIQYYKLEGKLARPGNDIEERSSSYGVTAEVDEDPSISTRNSVLLALIGARPQFYDCSIALHSLAQSCGEDGKLWELIVIWLKDIQGPDEKQVGNFISQLIPATPNKVFEFILTLMPPQTRTRSITLLERALFAFRPITLLELLDIAAVCDNPDGPHHGLPGESILRGVTVTLCGGLLTIRRKEVHLAHPMLRGFLTEKTIGGWLSLDSVASIHDRIATTCLKYLTSSKTIELMEHRAGPGSWHTSFERRDDFLSYAVKYWLRHATSTDKAIFGSELCTRFLEDNNVVRLWVILYQGLCPPVVNRRTLSANLASLAIFAEHEAEDLLISSLEKHRRLGTADFNFACLDALVAAARHGNMRMVKELLVSPLPEGETLDQATLAAIESGNKEVFFEIIKLGQSTPGGIRDFTLLLTRAASLGHVDFANVLLNLMKVSGVDINTSYYKSPLAYACQQGYAEVVELLIRKGGPIVMRELEVQNNTPLPIRLTVQFGQNNVLNILTSAVARRPGDFAAIQYYRSIFTESSVFGRRRPVRDILDFIDRNLQRGPSHFAGEMELSREINEGNRVLDYFNSKVIESDHSNSSEDAVVRAITRWPRSIDLIDFLIAQSQNIMKEAQFETQFEKWIEAAVTGGDVAVVKLVFENGAKVPHVTTEILEHVATLGFKVALSKQFTPCIKYLIEKGANITDRLPGSKETPLFYAAYMDFAEAVDELLKARPSKESLRSSLKEAVEKGRGHMIEKLLAYCPDSSYLLGIDNLLHCLVRDSNLKILQLLLGGQYQLDVNVRVGHGKTALHWISAKTSVEVVELLIAHGANIELATDGGYTPLAVAVYIPNAPVVRCLVENGALINIYSQNDGPFTLACYKGTLEMVKMMHTSKADPADVNHLHPSGSMGTPLNAALLRREQTADKEEIIRYLLEEGHADINIKSLAWGSALQVACLTSTIETVRMLIEQYQANTNVRDRVGRTPLHMALYRTRAHVELLLEHGARLDAVDIIKRNALHFAVLSGRLDVVKLVLDKEPTFVDEEDDHGWTPLLWALRVTGRWGAETSQLKAIVQELLSRGARRLVRGKGVDRTWTPMKTAQYYSIRNSVMRLVAPTPGDLEKINSNDNEWNWKSGGDKRGLPNEDEDTWCEHCLLGICGLAYGCRSDYCDTTYCLHCYQSSHKLHVSGHQGFYRWGDEEEEESDVGDLESSEGEMELDEETEEGDDGRQGEYAFGEGMDAGEEMDVDMVDEDEEMN